MRLQYITPLINSWHGFSPNENWLVFFSKSRTPYTRMFLIHINEKDNASPAALIDNAKAYTYIGEILLWQDNTVEAKKYLQQGREIDPSAAHAEIDLGIELSYREQFNLAIESSDCDSAAGHGKDILAVVPEDTEVNKSLVACRSRQKSQQTH